MPATLTKPPKSASKESTERPPKALPTTTAAAIPTTNQHARHPQPTTAHTSSRNIDSANIPTANLSAGKPDSNEASCCSTIASARNEVHARREERGPQPWIVLKLTVILALAIIGYTSEVYVRFCLDLIREGENRNHRLGITFLVVFCVLLGMMLWAYLKVLVTKPGQAKDYVLKCPRPPPHPNAHPRQYAYSSSDDEFDGDKDDDDDGQFGRPYDNPSHPSPTIAEKERYERDRQAGVLDAVTAPDKLKTHRSHSSHKHSSRLTRGSGRRHKSDETTASTSRARSIDTDPQTGVLDAVTVPTGLKTYHSHSSRRRPSRTTHGSGRRHRSDDATTSAVRTTSPTLPSPPTKTTEAQPDGHSAVENGPQRQPPTTPVLAPAFRYCARDGHIKPFRAHHCRACGTCILKYDHHCPWIGQCVGALNHKFFMNFLQWSSLFCAWLFSTLLPFSTPTHDADPQQIVVIALAVAFLLFTTSLLVSHVRLILTNESTVESMGHRNIKEREGRVLDRAGVPFWQCRTRGKIIARWDEEWGRGGREGNLWWLGSARANWEDVMGDRVLGWFLPIGRPLTDGLSYVPNPRFDSEGRWRRRSEWPKELR